MGNSLERYSVLQKIRELERHLDDQFVFLEVYGDGSGSVRQDRYGEDRCLFMFYDLDDFLSQADDFMKVKANIEVDPSNVMYEDEHFMIIRKEVE